MSIRANPKMRFPQDGAFGLVEAEYTSSLSGFRYRQTISVCSAYRVDLRI